MLNVISRSILMLILCFAATTYADTLWLKDGSQLVGDVTTIADHHVILETQFVGILSVDMDALQGITTARPLRFQLPDATPIEGLPEYRDNTQYLIDGSVSTVVAPEAFASLQDPAAPPIVEPAPLAEPTADWFGRVEMGLNGATGNSENFAFLGKTEATRKTESRLLYLYFRADYQEKNGSRSANEFVGGTRYEWVLTDRLNAFVKLELERDEFENLNLRATLTGGLAYTVVDSDRQSLITRGGIGYQREDFNNGVSDDQAVFDLGYDYRLDVWKQFRLIHKLHYLAVADDPLNDFRLIADSGGEIPLTKDEAWKLRLGMHNEYNNVPQPGVEHTDTKYYLNLVYDW